MYGSIACVFPSSDLYPAAPLSPHPLRSPSNNSVHGAAFGSAVCVTEVWVEATRAGVYS